MWTPTVVVIFLISMSVTIDAVHDYRNRFLMPQLRSDMMSDRRQPENLVMKPPTNSNNCLKWNNGICEDIESYPESEVSNLLQQNEELKSFAGTIIEPLMNIVNRNGDTDTFCRSTTTTVYPRFQVNTKGAQKFVINQGEAFQQAVTFEVCSAPKSTCPLFKDRLFGKDTSECVQKYNVIKLITFNAEKKKLEYDSFQIPSTCICVLKSS